MKNEKTKLKAFRVIMTDRVSLGKPRQYGFIGSFYQNGKLNGATFIYYTNITHFMSPDQIKTKKYLSTSHVCFGMISFNN